MGLWVFCFRAFTSYLLTSAVPSPAGGKPGVAWWWDHLAAQANVFSLAGFSAVLIARLMAPGPVRKSYE
jgi:hypothetical protein